MSNTTPRQSIAGLIWNAYVPIYKVLEGSWDLKVINWAVSRLTPIRGFIIPYISYLLSPLNLQVEAHRKEPMTKADRKSLRPPFIPPAVNYPQVADEKFGATQT